jgi:hypothetical protein
MGGVDTLTEADKARHATQAERVFELMNGCRRYWTLAGISKALNISEAGASARLRDFRKPEWGGHTVLKQRMAFGNQWLYKLTPNGPLLDGKRNTPTAKTEARERVTAHLDYRGTYRGGIALKHDRILAYGPPLLVSDLRELLK